MQNFPTKIPVILAMLWGTWALHASAPAPSSTIENAFVTPTSSPNDTRKYGYFVLPNRMRVLVISDPNATQAAAALSVGVGSASEPDERPGLAHFLEHMLFISTEKYPTPGAYQKFIGANGGETNAATSLSTTKFMFTVRPEKLPEALDRFAQFFISPSLDPLYVQREKHAVHSEYQLKIKDNNRRTLAAAQHAYNPKSAYGRFAVGNLTTLADHPGHRVHDDLVAFYQRHYSANIMGLVLLGRQDLPALKKLAIQAFSGVADRDASRYVPQDDAKLFAPGQLPARLSIRPLDDRHNVTFTFPLPSLLPAYPTAPMLFLGHLIASAAPGTLYDRLHQKGWINGIGTSADSLDARQGELVVGFDLTAEGMKHLETIGKLFYEYIALIRQKGIVPWRYAQLQRLNDMTFRFLPRAESFGYVAGLSDRLLDYPGKDILTGGHLLRRYDVALIRHYLDAIRPDNALTVLTDQHAATDQVDPYYHTPYKLIPIDPGKVRKHFSPRENFSGLRLPEANPYIPKNPQLLSIEGNASSVPQAIETRPGWKVWHQQDVSFRVPRAVVMILLRTPAANLNAEAFVSSDLLVALKLDGMQALLNAASQAGMGLSLSSGREGIRLSLHGYDEKMPQLFHEVLTRLSDATIDPARFALQKELLRRQITQRKLDHAHAQVIAAVGRKVFLPSFSPEEQLEALKHVTPSRLAAHHAALFGTVAVEMLTLGNITRTQSLSLRNDLHKTLLHGAPLRPVSKPEATLPPVDHPAHVAFEVDHPDAVHIDLDIGADTHIQQRALWQLLAQFYKGTFYGQLRTEQQLGYVVMALHTVIGKHPAMLSIVQSSSVSTEELAKRIAAFRSAFYQELQSMDPKTFATTQAGLVALLSKRDSSLGDRAEHYWANLSMEHTGFDINRRVADAVKEIRQETLVDFYQKHFLKHPIRLTGISHGTRFGQKASPAHPNPKGAPASK